MAAPKDEWVDVPEEQWEDVAPPAAPTEAPPAPPAPPLEPMGAGNAAGLGVLEALSYGFAPKMHGLAKSAMGGLGERVKLGAAFQPDPGDTPEVAEIKRQALAEQAAQPSDYELNKRAYEGLTQHAEKDRPGAYLGGQLGTGLAQGLAAGGLARAGIAVPSLLRRIGVGAAEGLAQGGLAGAGHSQGEVTTKAGAGQLLKDILAGGAVGATVGGGLPAAGAALRGAGRGIVNFAADQAPDWALKAAGGIQKDFKALGEDAREYGQFLLDQGMIPFAGSKTAVLNRLRGLQERAGQTIGQGLDDNQAQPNVLNVLRQVYGDTAALPATSRRLQGGERNALASDISEQFGMQPVPPMMVPAPTQNQTARGLNALKSDIDARVKWRPGTQAEAETSQARRAVANRLRGELYETTDRGLSPERAAAFREAMQQYGPASDLISYAEQGVAREGGSTLLGLLAPIAGTGVAGAIGSQRGTGEGLGAGAATVGGLVAAKRFGPAALARILQGTARAGQRLDPARLPPSVLRALASPRGLAAPIERSLAPSALPQRSYAPLEAYLDEER